MTSSEVYITQYTYPEINGDQRKRPPVTKTLDVRGLLVI